MTSSFAQEPYVLPNYDDERRAYPSLRTFGSTDGSSPAPRPTLPRLATDQILDYYKSPDAGTGAYRTSATTSPALSSAQPSTVNATRDRYRGAAAASAAPAETSPRQSPTNPILWSPVIPQQRGRLPSAGAADNRRLHVVELDASPPTADDRQQSPSSDPQTLRRTKTSGASAQSNLLSRRGVLDHGRLALVAPPDASPSSYINLSPPDPTLPRSAPAKRLRHAVPQLSDNDGDESELATRDHRRTRSGFSHPGDQGPSRRRIGGAESTSPGGRREREREREREPAATSGGAGVLDPTTWKRSSASVPTSSTASERLPVLGGTAASMAGVATTSKATRAEMTEDLARPQLSASSSWRTQSSGAAGSASLDSRPTFLPHTTSSSQVVTPAIGEEKDPMTRVAGPVMVGFPDLTNGMGYNVPSLASSSPQSQPTLTSSNEPTSNPASRPPSGGIGPPPPRPPRATVARRVGTLPIQLEVGPSTTKPSISTMDSEHAASGSGTGRVSASSPTKSQHEMDPIPEARHRREGAAGLTVDDMNLQRASSASADTFGPMTSDPLTSEPPRGTLSRGYSSPTGTSRPPSSGSPEGNPSRPELVSRWSTNSSFPSPAAKRLTGGRNYAPLTVGDDYEDLSLAVDRQLATMGLMAEGSGALTSPPVEAKRSSTRSPLDTVDETVGVRLIRTATQESKSKSNSPLPSPSLTGPASRGASRSPPVPSLSIDISPTNAWTAHLKPGLGPVSPAIIRPPTPLLDEPKPKSSPAASSARLQSSTPEAGSDRLTVTRSASVDSREPDSRDSPLPAIPPHRSPSPAYSALKQYMSPSQLKIENAIPKEKKRPRNPRKLPPSIYCGDIVAKKNPLDRLLMYEKRMKELNSEEDSGLVDWIDWVRSGKRLGPVGKPDKEAGAARGPSRSSSSVSSGSQALPHRVPQKRIKGFNHPPLHAHRLREVSNGSVASEMTFPIRPDAYVATNLSSPSDGSPMNGPPPNIPYPGLAQNAGVRNTIKRPQRTNSQPGPKGLNSMGSLRGPPASKSNGFFSSLGRKASLKKQHPGVPANPSGLAALVSRPNHINLDGGLPPPVPIKLNAPTLMGGPRPAPHKRSTAIADRGPPPPPPADDQLISEDSIPEEDSVGEMESFAGHTNDDDRSSMHSASVAHSFYTDGSPMHPPGLVPKSSLSYRSHGHGRAATADEDPDAEFAANLEKVTDVLPHVDRETLALYLRKAGGEDMRAIGTYLEDERKGVVMIA